MIMQWAVAGVDVAAGVNDGQNWLWHGFRDGVGPGVSGGAVIMVFVIMLVVRS
jgi:hypothetical protein